MLNNWLIKLRLVMLKADLRCAEGWFDTAVAAWKAGHLTYDEGPGAAGLRCGRIKDRIEYLQRHLK